MQAAVLILHLQLAIFLTSMGLMEGRDVQHIGGKFKDLYGQAIVANWRVWPLAQVCILKASSVLANRCTADQLPFHAIGIPSSIPKHMWGILDIVPLITEFYVSLASSTISLLRAHWLETVKMCSKIAAT